MFCPFCTTADSVIRLPSSTGIDDAAKAMVQVIKVAFPRRDPAIVLEGSPQPMRINEPKATERISAEVAKCLRAGRREVGDIRDGTGALAKITIELESLPRCQITVPTRSHSLQAIEVVDL